VSRLLLVLSIPRGSNRRHVPSPGGLASCSMNIPTQEVPKMTDLARLWTIGYGLDMGGHEFSEPEEGEVFHGEPETFLLWEDPDLNYCPGWPPHMSGSADLLVIAPREYMQSTYTFPEKIIWPDRTWTRLAHGWLNSTDRECYCHGRPVKRPDEQTGEWEFTGNLLDPAYPDCDRCEGDGSVESPGGNWAIYEMSWPEEEED